MSGLVVGVSLALAPEKAAVVVLDWAFIEAEGK